MSEENLENEKPVEQTPPPNSMQFPITNLGFTQATDDEEEAQSGSKDIAKLNELSEQYRKTDIEKGDVFIDPATGKIIDRDSLPPLEQIKIVARNMGHTINNPDKNCKKCHGRGYQGKRVEDNAPIPCSCIYKDYYKEHPEVKKQMEQMPAVNRKARRFYDKQMKKFINSRVNEEMEKQALINYSKANLKKFTGPKVDATVVETAEGTIGEVSENVENVSKGVAENA
jgi:hypothetical protein